MHIILFINSLFFEIFGIKTRYNLGKTKPVIEWIKEVRKRERNKGFSLYINKFISACYILLHGTHPSRMVHEFKKTLQLRKDTILGDWYLVEDHTIIIVYGFE